MVSLPVAQDTYLHARRRGRPLTSLVAGPVRIDGVERRTMPLNQDRGQRPPDTSRAWSGRLQCGVSFGFGMR